MITILRNPEHYKKVISKFYTGVCTVEVKSSVTDKETFKTRPENKILYEDIPCRLSHESKATAESYQRNTVKQTIKLFLDNKYQIPAGSKITVLQDDILNTYGAASEPNVFETHQEIELILWEDYSGERL